ncbi:MAG: putative 2-aminoethylphosphonate ABC transporter substrate-binding protein [Holophaga sp.]|jgi:iron(III) transport system substrate-binding protein
MHLRRLIAALAANIALAAAGSACLASETIRVYTALEADQIQAYEQSFNKAYPDVKIEWVRDSTGIITSKLLAEKANPQADVVMGLAASSLLLMEKENLLLPYAPKGVEKLNKRYVSEKNPPTWVGMDVWGAAICFNTVEAQKQGLPKPETWKDLLKPVYKGKIVMPNPASSGTGYFDVSAWLTLFKEKGGWDYMDKLHENIGLYVHSGSKPGKMAASGEFPIGITFEYRAAKLKAEGAPIDLIFPKEGCGWDLEATGIMKTTKHLAACKKLADWCASKDANELYKENFAIVAYPGVVSPNPLLPKNFEAMLVKQDLKWSAANRDRILDEWTKRYDGKSEPKE